MKTPFLIILLSCSHLIFGQKLYDLDTITQIELSFAEEDWQFPLHYYYSLKKGQRHLGNAFINGKEFKEVGVRFKGFSSYQRRYKKNPLNISLDHIHKKASYGKYETLKLTNGNLDPSWLREVLGYQIARKYMIAPQANFAQVYVNNEYYGLFGNVEHVNDDFCKRKFKASKKNVLIKGNSPLGVFAGKRSSLEYLGEDTTLYAQAYELKSDYGWTALKELTRILQQAPEKIETILNMDVAIWMLAFNNVLVNLDSYSDFQQNYYLFQDEHNRFNFILWDLNLAFDGLGKPAGITMQHDYDPFQYRYDKRFPLINLVLKDPTYQKQYIAHSKTILQEILASDWVQKKAEKHHSLIAEAVKTDMNWYFSFTDFERNLFETVYRKGSNPFPYPGILEFVEARKTYLQQHPTYQQQAPVIDSMEVFKNPIDTQQITVRIKVDAAKKVWFYYRNTPSDLFRKIILLDDGEHEDEQAKDGIFGNTLHGGSTGLQYYLYVENSEAGLFNPPRAAFEFYSLRE